jgi:hypothetical protein
VVKAEDAAPAVVTERTAPTSYAGKVVVIDKLANTFTVEIQGQLYLFKLNPQSKVLRKGKEVSLRDLAPGQEIKLVIQQGVDGAIEVVSLTIQPGQTQAEAAGPQPAKKPSPRSPNSPNYSSPPSVSPYN